jgi:hypothetical protein
MGGGGAPRYRGPAPPHPLPPGYDPPPAYGPPTPTPPPFNPNGGRSKGKKRKVNGAPAAPGGAPAAPTPYNPWTGSIYMYPMGTGILGPRPGAASTRPAAHGFMASPQAAAPAPYGYYNTAAPYGYAPATPAPYGYAPAPTTPSWDATVLSNQLNAMSLQPPPTEWVMDTGASAYMSSDAGILKNLNSRAPFSSVVVGDGSSLPVTSSGYASLRSSFFNRPLHLQNVLVTPSIIKNLISVTQFTCDNCVSIEFDPAGFSVKDIYTKAVILWCNSSRLDRLHRRPTLWHRRLGHPGHDSLRRLASSLPCHKEIKGSSLCHACQLGRHVRLPFSDSTSRTLRPFELVHCDLWTSPVESMSGYKYFLVILDDFTHFLWTCPLRWKSETFGVLSNFRTYVQTQFALTLQQM